MALVGARGHAANSVLSRRSATLSTAADQAPFRLQAVGSVFDPLASYSGNGAAGASPLARASANCASAHCSAAGASH